MATDARVNQPVVELDLRGSVQGHQLSTRLESIQSLIAEADSLLNRPFHSTRSAGESGQRHP